ncbi:MAG: transposase [Dethiobacteria bacterium]
MESPTGYYHAMMRGNNREAIFYKNSEKRLFLELLQQQVDDKNISLAAYCLMDNHVHLLICSSLQEMSEAIKWINIKFAGNYNYKYQRVGHVFQGRFRSEIIDTERYFLQAMRYIHNNPVKAKIVKKAQSYEWSSYNSYIGHKCSVIAATEIQKVIALFSNSIRDYANFHLEEDDNEFLEIEEDLQKEREEKAGQIIKRYLRQRDTGAGIEGLLGLEKDIKENIIKEMISKTHLTHRRIAELMGVSRGMVHSIAKK